MKRLILLVLSLLVVAAGGGPIRAQEEQAQQEPAQQGSAILIVPGLVTVLRVPNWVALSEGLYKKNGLNIDQCVPPGDVRDLKRILGVDAPVEYRCKPGAPRGPITIAGGLPTSFMAQFQVNSSGKVPPKQIILATVQNRTNYVMIARKDITRPEQLHGKTIGVTGFFNIMGYQTLLFVQAMGWEPGKDITIIQEPTGTMEGMEAGKYDAYIAGEGLPEWQAEHAGYKPLIDFKQWKIPMTSSSVDVDAEWLKNNRDTARGFIKSMVEAIAIMRQDKKAAFRAMTKYYGITDPKQLEYFYSTWTVPAKPYPDVEGLRIAQKLYATFPGVKSEELKNAKIEDFIDDSFVRELDQSGYIDSLYKKK